MNRAYSNNLDCKHEFYSTFYVESESENLIGDDLFENTRCSSPTLHGNDYQVRIESKYYKAFLKNGYLDSNFLCTDKRHWVDYNSFNFHDIDLYQHEEAIFYLERFQKKIYTSVYVVFWMENLFDNYEFNKINAILSDIDIKFLEEWSIVSLLRSTYFAKDYLPAWYDFYVKAKKYLIEVLEKNDVDSILIGLDR